MNRCNKMSNKNVNSRENSGEIIKQGSLKKLKTMKKKYFVLRSESGDSPARLEYYVNEKKFRANCLPKRVIKLKSCFNINRKNDSKQRHVIALYSHSGCFSIVFDTEEEMEDWLKALLRLQLGENTPVGEQVKPTFEHVWEVTIMSRDMGGRIGLLGPYHLCLTDQTLTLVKASDNDTFNTIEFSLQKIKACGHMESFFYMQVGSDTVTGAGNLWMTTEDAIIAGTMHATIMSACGKCSKKELQPLSRIRSSSSATENSKPSILQRWPTHTESVQGGVSKVELEPPIPSTRTEAGSSGGLVKSACGASSRTALTSERRHSLAAGSGSLPAALVVTHQRTYSFPLTPLTNSTHHQHSLTCVRERSDSIPSRERTISEPVEGTTNPPFRHSRPSSMYNKAQSPPLHSHTLLSPQGDSEEGSSMSMDGEGDWDDHGITRYPHSLTPDEPVIFEETTDGGRYAHWQEDEKLNNYMSMDQQQCHRTTSNLNNTNASYRKISPNPFSAKSNSPSQGPFPDTYNSPSSSPLDTPGSGYMPMSPGIGALYSHHSRDSSIAEEGCTTVAPPPSDDGYMDMDQRNNRDRWQSGNTSTGSSCSLTSGTPSGDINKLSDSLDKVPSYICKDDEVLGPRSTRAWSVGSRPNNIPSKTDVTCTDGNRERACSWGSRNVPRSVFRISSLMNPPMSSSHPTVEPADDLMEMDFSKKAKQSRNQKNKKPSSAERLSEGGGLSPPKTGRLAALFGRSPPKPATSPPQSHPSPCLDRVLETEPGYLDMTPSTPSQQPYMEMRPVIAPKHPLKPQNFPKTTFSPPIKPPLFSSKEDYLDMSLKRKTSIIEDNNNSKVIVGTQSDPLGKDTDGYVEMSLKKGSEDANYVNMEKKNRKDLKNSRYSSPPIKIQGKDAVYKRKLSNHPSPVASPQVEVWRKQNKDGQTPSSSESCGEYIPFQPQGRVTTTPPDTADYIPYKPAALNEPSPSSHSDYTPMDPANMKNTSVEALRKDINSLNLTADIRLKTEGTEGVKTVGRTNSIKCISEKEVQYASLDLQTADEGRLSTAQALPYAEIDFVKSKFVP